MVGLHQHLGYLENAGGSGPGFERSEENPLSAGVWGRDRKRARHGKEENFPLESTFFLYKYFSIYFFLCL